MFTEQRGAQPTLTAAFPPVVPMEQTVNHLLGFRGSALERHQIMSFAMHDGIMPPPFLFAEPMPQVAELAYDLQNTTRKVSGEPYFKHVLRTVFLSAQAAVMADLPAPETRILIAAAYHHDSLELQRNLKQPYDENDLGAALFRRGMESEEALRASALVREMTPPCEGKTIADHQSYIRHKIRVFRDKFALTHTDEQLLHILKAADLTANIEETIDDLMRGRDDGRMGRPYRVRMHIFRACTEIIAAYDPGNPLLDHLRMELGKRI